jgi:hypothetical protein
MHWIQKQQSNLGGISQFFLIPPDDYQSISDVLTDGLRYVTFSSFDNTWGFSVIYQSILFSEKLEPTHAGNLYTRTFQANLAKDSALPYASLHILLNRTWLLVYQYQNGQW